MESGGGPQRRRSATACATSITYAMTASACSTCCRTAQSMSGDGERCFSVVVAATASLRLSADSVEEVGDNVVGETAEADATLRKPAPAPTVVVAGRALRLNVRFSGTTLCDAASVAVMPA